VVLGESSDLGWRGSGNENLNVAAVGLFGTTAGGFGIGDLTGKAVLEDTSPDSPALAAHDGRLFLAWRGDEPAETAPSFADSWPNAPHLNLRVSGDGTFRPGGPWFFPDLSSAGFYTAIYRTPPARAGHLDPPPDNLALLYAMEAEGMDFATFKQLTMDRNSALPASLEYGQTYEFHAPDDKVFSIWFQLTQEKHTARVVERDDPVRDLTTLPLASLQPHRRAARRRGTAGPHLRRRSRACRAPGLRHHLRQRPPEPGRQADRRAPPPGRSGASPHRRSPPIASTPPRPAPTVPSRSPS
jgi:hypothetical protein